MKYRIVSSRGFGVSTHQPLESAVREVEKHNAWLDWSIKRLGADGVTLEPLTAEEEQEVHLRRYPGLAEVDASL